MSESGRSTDAWFTAELYEELHRIAQRWMSGQPRCHSLQATALLNEAYLKLGCDERRFRDRVHFLSAASRAMRHILVDHARSRRAAKRTPPGARQELDRVVVTYESRALDLIALDEALDRLREFDPEMARAVELRFFGGLSMKDIARTLGVAPRSLERRWKAVRAWLHAEIR